MEAIPDHPPDCGLHGLAALVHHGEGEVTLDKFSHQGVTATPRQCPEHYGGIGQNLG